MDTPTPYEYSCQKYTKGVPTGGPFFEYDQDDQNPVKQPFTKTLSSTTTPAYWERTISLGQVTIHVVDVAGSPGQAFIPDKYSWPRRCLVPGLA